MYTLGINAAFHDSAACLVRDGAIVAAAEEERFSGIKHAKRPVPFSAYELPFHAIDHCLSVAGICLPQVDHVAYSFDPALFPVSGNNGGQIRLPLDPGGGPQAADGASVWDPLFLCYMHTAPRQLADGAPHHLRVRFRKVSGGAPYRWHFVSHHRAHAASAFFVSPFREAAVMTLDGRGEQETTSYAAGRGTSLELIGSVPMPHSLGLLYERVTSYLGFLHSSDEYKVMSLASFGKPVHETVLRDHIELDGNGGYRIRQMDLPSLFGPPRERGGSLEQRHYDLARSLQAVLEETVLELAGWLRSKSGMDALCMAGGVALNCVMNSALRDRGPFKKIWVQPAAGDAGTALGAALAIDLQERTAQTRPHPMEHCYWGPCYSDREIEEQLRRSRLPVLRMVDPAETVGDLLVRGNVVGWFQGRMEFGPRALGARSILASPLEKDMQARLNEIKDREDFRPVAPVVLEEEAGAWFEDADVSPFMLFVHRVRPERKARIPAVCHVDGTARIQTVNRRQNPGLHDLIAAVKRKTGVPILINTSFNTRGRPIVCSPRDAVECFYTSPLDALALGPFLLTKRGALP
jgi:carbamoyltransferase